MSKDLQKLLESQLAQPKFSKYKLREQTADARAKGRKALKGRARSAKDVAKIVEGRLANGGWASPTEETRAKLRDANLGKKYSAETCAKRSASLKGKKRTDETKAKLSTAMQGKKMSAEHKEAMSKAAKERHARERAERAAGVRAPVKGTPWTEERREAMRKAHREVWARRKAKKSK